MSTTLPLIDIETPEIVLNAKLVSTANLSPHPLSIKVYGEPTASEELLRSVREIGVIQPIIIMPREDSKFLVIAGTSRHFAAVQAGHAKIPAVLFTGSELQAEWLVLESNRQRVKVASRLGREFNERFRLEGEFAKLRQQAGVPLKMAEGGDARDKAAKAVNLGRTTAERIGKLARKADEGNQKARNLLHKVDNEEISISAAFIEFEAKNKEGKAAHCPECKQEFPSLSKLYKHGRHEHGMETQAIRKRLGFDSDVPAYKKDSAKSIINTNDLQIKTTAMVKRLEMFLPVKANKPYHQNKYNDAENVFVKDIRDALHFLNNPPVKNLTPWTSDAAVADGVQNLRSTLLRVASELNAYAKRIPVVKSKVVFTSSKVKA